MTQLLIDWDVKLTSLAAQDSIRDVAPSLRERIYRYLEMVGGAGATRDEIEDWTKIPGSTVRPRVKELLESGRIVETDEKRATRSGRAAYVLVVAS